LIERRFACVNAGEATYRRKNVYAEAKFRLFQRYATVLHTSRRQVQGTLHKFTRSTSEAAGKACRQVGWEFDLFIELGTEVFLMLSWALTFFVVAIIAAVLGFTSIAGAAAGIAKILFFIFLVLTLVALVGGALRGRPPV
jgi:uncharacterized membrane protein YtjA (UPF0391 family)